MTNMTFREYIENLKQRGYKEPALQEFIKRVSSEEACKSRALWEWNVVLDNYLYGKLK